MKQLLDKYGATVSEALKGLVFNPAEGSLRLDPAQIRARGKAGLYLHVPFCASRCSYCCFNTVISPRRVEGYARAVERELSYWAGHPGLKALKVSSIYLGGGTPSHLPPEVIARLLQAAGDSFTLEEDVQTTLEANPESLTPSRLRQYHEAGINRLSVGVQTFDQEILRRLGRPHRKSDIEQALLAAHEGGFHEVSADLMYGLPGQRMQDFEADLRRLMASPISHLSLFAMVYVAGRPVAQYRGTARASRWRMYDHALKILRGAGFEQYTSEDFTRSSVRCHYQSDVWQPPARGCLGIGPGARSVLTDSSWFNVGDLEAYIDATRRKRPPMANGVVLQRHQQMVDYLLGSAKCLRFDERDFHRRFGSPPGPKYRSLLLLLRAAGLAHRPSPGVLALTSRGSFLASVLWGDFILKKLGEAAASTEARS